MTVPRNLWSACKGALILLLAIAGIVGAQSVAAAPSQAKRLTGIAATDCKSCHGGAKLLPDKHANIAGMTWEQCRGCHDSPTKSLRKKLPLSHTHLLAGNTCQDCHGNAQAPAALASDQCLSCHGSREAVVKLTKHLPHNPHTSPHYGPDLDCDACHRQHARSENFCAECHHWEMSVPNQY